MGIIIFSQLPTGSCLRRNSKYAGGGHGGGVIPLRFVRKKKSRTKWWFLLHFLNLNTDLIASKTEVKNSQNPIALVQKYCRMGILWMIGIHQLVYKDLTRVRHVLLHFSRFKTFLFFGHSKIKVRSCVICLYSGTPLAKNTSQVFNQTAFLPVLVLTALLVGVQILIFTLHFK